MARDHARLQFRLWEPDSDFRDCDVDEQLLYVKVVSQPLVNNAGVLPLQVKKWARMTKHATEADVEKALRGLEDKRYLFIDEETDEVLIRTFIRGDGIVKQPNVLKNALRVARQIESRRLRVLLAQELRRLTGLVPGSAWLAVLETAEYLDPTAAAPSSEPSAEPFTEPFRKGSGNPSGNPSSRGQRNPSSSPERNPSSDPAGRGRVKGVSSCSGELDLEERDARDHAAGPGEPKDLSPSLAPLLDPENPRCGQHAHFGRSEAGPRCHACKAVRLEMERAVAQVAAEEGPVDDAAARRAAIDACSLCNEFGLTEIDDDGRSRRCTHPAPGPQDSTSTTRGVA